MLKIIIIFIVAIFCLLLYAFVLLNACLYVDGCKGEEFPINLEFMFNRYQTLLTGIIALMVGFMAVRAVQAQIKSHEDGRAKDREIAEEELVIGIADSAFHYVAALENALTQTLNRISIGMTDTTEFLRRLTPQPPFFHRKWRLLASVGKGKRKIVQLIARETDDVERFYTVVLKDIKTYPELAVRHDLEEARKSLSVIKEKREELYAMYKRDINEV